MNTQDTLSALKRAHLFSCLSDEQIERVRQHARTVHLDEGQPLFAQGDEVRYFYLVLEGQIKLFLLSPDGQEKIIEIINPGQSFAEALMFLDRPHYPVSASALKAAEVVRIDSRDFSDMLRGSVESCFLLLGSMSQRLHALVKEIDDLTLHTGSCRVAAYLLKNAPDKSDTYRLEVPKSVIASRLSVKPETFSRIIKHLSEEGIISVNRDEIQIHDRDALEARAELHRDG